MSEAKPPGWEPDTQFATPDVSETPPPADEDLDGFDPRTADDVQGLIYLGRLEKTYDVFGHDFHMRTLKSGEELAVGQVANEFAGTIYQGRAIAIALVGASIVKVDDREIVAQLGPNTETYVRDRFQYIKKNWDYSVVAEAYKHYLDLEGRKTAAYEALLGK